MAFYGAPEIHQGDRFLDDFYATSQLLVKVPDIGRVISGDVRRWHLRVFPYQLWYRVAHEQKLVRIICLVGDAQDEQRFVTGLG